VSRQEIECINCGGTAGYHYDAQLYGDPSDCYPAEDSVEVEDEQDRPFCSVECLEEWHEEHDEDDGGEDNDEDEGEVTT
jgi:endogenous inhibitor of DNA gyrase (YacG/DUF329 family)